MTYKIIIDDFTWKIFKSFNNDDLYNQIRTWLADIGKADQISEIQIESKTLHDVYLSFAEI